MSYNQNGWNFDNSYVNLSDFFYTVTKPEPVEKPEIVTFNEKLAQRLGLSVSLAKTGAAIFAGNELPKGAEPVAQAYAGHQFGHFTMLGDGRAILLGEQITTQGERFDIQLKGAGRTSYSRGGDGRATLEAMLREYIISEAMNGLQIPTTRSLAVVTTGEPVFREVEYMGAILTRVASSHIRVGTFQYAAVYGTEEELRELADYTIDRHYPYLKEKDNPYVELLEAVMKRQAELVAKWMLAGFIHGVMNTDNMTISGETIDYGPCAFMNYYDPDTVFSSIDHGGRYRYRNQPAIAHWNLTRFAETLLPLIDDDEKTAIARVKEALNQYPHHFYDHWMNGMRAKLGLVEEEEDDETLIDELLQAMKKYEADFTNTFLSLTYNKLEGAVLFQSQEFKQWYERWNNRRKSQNMSLDESRELMYRHNPAVIPRNHRVEEVLEAAVEKNDFQPLETLMSLLSNPFEHSDEQIEYNKDPIPVGPYVTYCGT